MAGSKVTQSTISYASGPLLTTAMAAGLKLPITMYLVGSNGQQIAREFRADGTGNPHLSAEIGPAGLEFPILARYENDAGGVYEAQLGPPLAGD